MPGEETSESRYLKIHTSLASAASIVLVLGTSTGQTRAMGQTAMARTYLPARHRLKSCSHCLSPQ